MVRRDGEKLIIGSVRAYSFKELPHFPFPAL
jgi:hypothetical protein